MPRSTRRCSLHPSDASAEMNAEAVFALIDAFCGSPESKIHSSILDQPPRVLLCGRRFMASFPQLHPLPRPLLLHMLKLATLVIVAILSSETPAETQTIASDSSHFLLRLFIRCLKKRTSVIQLAVHDLTMCWKISVSSQGEALDSCTL